MKKTTKKSPRKLTLRAQTIAVMVLSENALRDQRVAGGSYHSTSLCCSDSE